MLDELKLHQSEGSVVCVAEVFAWSQCELFASINADVTDADSPFLTCLVSQSQLLLSQPIRSQ